MSHIEFTTRSIKQAAKNPTDCAIITLGSDLKLDNTCAQLNDASDGAIKKLLALGDFKGKPGDVKILNGGGRCKRIMLVGSGRDGVSNEAATRRVIQAIYKALNGTSVTSATLHLGGFSGDKSEYAAFCTALARDLTSASYRYTKTVSKPKAPLALKKLTVNISNTLSSSKAQAALDIGAAQGKGINFAKELANLPGNECTPTHLANEAKAMAKQHPRLSTKILNENRMRQLGMHSLLSVTAGTDEPAKFIIMEYKGGKARQKPIVLVGKGITFDSGGISLKPGAKMDEMKFDMGGAASVFGTMRALLELNLNINVVALIAAAENMPSGKATKPGDVVTSMSGQTIEILNTDAEGRLVLCDALTYAERYKPAAVIDVATLTGACVVALGHQATGLYANEDKLAEQLLAAGEKTYDRAWRMPLWDEYQNQLDSNFADIANIGGPTAGSVTAACFLSRFTKNYDWAHLDIAGSAWKSAPKGASGRPVGLLTRFLMDREND
ncbi:MAG: leucyl aminopeptidase [Gammaproteobacteria bacterium]|nr:MAG: leucyl aminopeptidase [Gammaproteobacteria bacterium]